MIVGCRFCGGMDGTGRAAPGGCMQEELVMVGALVVGAPLETHLMAPDIAWAPLDPCRKGREKLVWYQIVPKVLEWLWWELSVVG